MSGARALGAFLILFGATALAPQQSFATKVGVAAAVNPDAFSGSGGNRKQLRIGKSIFYNERISTDANGVVQVLLVDGSTFTVGRNSNVVIDRFVYDPNKKTGEIVASFSKGSMRFIGGKISKNPDGVKVNTPDGSLAIRGGMFQGAILPGGSIFSFLFGNELVFRGRNGRVEVLYQPGYSLVFGPNGPIIRPTTPEDIQIIMSSLTNSNVSPTTTNTENDPPPPDYVVNLLNMQQLIVDATQTRIDGELQSQLAALNDIVPEEPTIQSSIGGFASGLILGGNAEEFGFAASTSPEDLFYNENTGNLSITLRDVEDGQGIDSGEFRFAPTGPNTWDLARVRLFDQDGSEISVTESSGFAAAEPGNLCSSCDFIKWGSFGAEFTYVDPLSKDGITDEIGLGWWVAGQVTDPKDLPQTGTARYDGKAVGTVALPDSFDTVVGKGDVGMSWDFAKRSGQFSISDFNAAPKHKLPDLNVRGTMTMPGNFNRFSGDLAGRAGQESISGAAFGSFVTDGKAPAAGTIGNWGVSGQNGYRATGVFGAKARN